MALPAAAAAEPRYHLAVIGDVPYDAAQDAYLPTLIGAVNADPQVQAAVHLGDIKSGGTPCSDAWFAHIKDDVFGAFDDPLVYTPGDNEWTDCHRPTNGPYNPLERLARIREVFFPTPGQTLGRHPMAVTAQAAPYVENVRWYRSRVAFGTVHVVGSNNSLAPWTGLTEPTPEQLQEVEGRTQAALDQIDAVFDRAELVSSTGRRGKGVVLMMQADMWDGAAANQTGFAAIKERIAQRARAFRKPVILLEGDSHGYKVDHPLPTAPNVTRIVVEGSAPAREWLELRVVPDSRGIFFWSRRPVPAT
ncbi:MAG: metallophosphoesterase [Solirubrobacterales bacterium]|nr:metallophosphoesterase [Solirubrobacterales bacterium]